MDGGGEARKKILVVDDDQWFCGAVGDLLASRGYAPVVRFSVTDALAVLSTSRVDVVLTDLALGEGTGMDLCQEIADRWPEVPAIVMTGQSEVETVVAVMRSGATDFVPKPIDGTRLAAAIERSLRHVELERERGERTTPGSTFEGLMGESEAMRGVFGLCQRVAPIDCSVLITGESGTGKELVARAIHRRSGRAGRPFVALNCAALPEPLLESELFGHARGAFTDAHAAHEGLFVQANGGTLFLDEIGEMPMATQAKILRAVQERVIRPVGSRTEIPIDMRVLTATNIDLADAVAAGKFRADLYFRINVVEIRLPPLRARGDDVVLLASHFAAVFGARHGARPRKLAPAAVERLRQDRWSGNVRELANCIERAVALSPDDVIGVRDLPERLQRTRSRPPIEDPVDLVTMEEVEKRHIRHVLRSVAHNRSQAAEILGFDRRTLQRKLKKYGLTRRGED